MLQKEGPVTAVKHYEKLAEIGDLENIFGYAWAKQENREFDLALELSSLILDNTTSEHLEAKVFFLQATIEQKTGSPQKAIRHYKESEKRYLEINNPKGRYLCYLKIAFNQIALGESDLALQTLEHARAMQSHISNPGQYKQIKSIAFRNLEKWNESIPLAIEALAHYREQAAPRKAIDCMYEIAFQHALAHQTANARHFLNKANTLDTRKEHRFSKLLTELAICLAESNACNNFKDSLTPLLDTESRRTSFRLLIKRYKE